MRGLDNGGFEFRVKALAPVFRFNPAPRQFRDGVRQVQQRGRANHDVILIEQRPHLSRLYLRPIERGGTRQYGRFFVGLIRQLPGQC